MHCGTINIISRGIYFLPKIPLCLHSFHAPDLMRNSNLIKKKHDYLIHGSVQWLNKRSSCTEQLHELKINCASLCKGAEKIFCQSAYNQNLFLTSCKNIFLKNANKKREREISTMSKFLIDRGEKASVRFIKIMLPFIEFLGNVFLFFKTLQDRLR